MSQIKISVIIPCYYSSNILCETLDSLVKQTKRQNLVIYLINNNSPYTTEEQYQEIIKNYSKFFQIFYIRNEKNFGPGIARQQGLNQSKEDYILFMDDDDHLANAQVIEKYLYYAEKGYNIISSFHINIVKKDNEIIEVLEQPTLIYTVGDLFKKSFLDKYNIHFHKDNSFYCEHAYFLRQIYFFLSKEEEKTYIKIPEFLYLVFHSDKTETITWNKKDNIIFLEEQIISEALQIQFYQEHLDELTLNEKIIIIRILSSYYCNNDLILSYIEQNGFYPLLQNKQILYNNWLYIIDLINKNKKLLKKNDSFNYLKDFLPNYQEKNFYETFKERFDKI